MPRLRTKRRDRIGNKHYKPEAVRSECHHNAVQHDHLPQGVGEGAGDQAQRQQSTAHQDQPTWSKPVHQNADEWRCRAGNQLRYRIGDGTFGAAPAERLDEGDQEHRVGMHAGRTHREGDERGGQQQARLTRGWTEGQWGADPHGLAASVRCHTAQVVCAPRSAGSTPWRASRGRAIVAFRAVGAPMDALQPVDRIDIQVLVDNVTDSLSSTPSFVTREWTTTAAGRGCASPPALRCAAPIMDYRW